jgi:glycosyltransferase involved in cell wall biosynthesis
MRIKKTILILVSQYLPGFKAGGPIRSIASLVEGLKDEYNFKIVCGDRDLGDKKPFASEPIGRWYEYGPAKILRIRPGLSGARMMFQALRQESYDILYINGIWPRIYSMLPLVCRRLGLLQQRTIVLAPRGECSTGALEIKSKRKRLYLKFAKLTRLFDGVLWQASNKDERRKILRVLGRIDVEDKATIDDRLSPINGHLTKFEVIIATNIGVGPKQVENRAGTSSKAPGELRVATLGRICKMKNIEFAIRLFKQVQGRVSYDIYGPLEDKEYVAKCKRLCIEMPDSVTIRFMGGIPYETVPATLSQYHVFLLPTLGENFGHVISEAMLAGCVPLISDQTRWRNLKDFDAGWDLSLLSPEAFTNALQAAVAWSVEEFQRHSNSARSHAIIHGSPVNSIIENKLLFEAAASRQDRSMVKGSRQAACGGD